VKTVDDSRHRAEFFDALAHPTRIRILKALEEKTLSFADLKKRMSTKSSGHLQHHLSKLGDLIKTDKHGRYCLSEQGKDALFTVQIVENTGGFGGERKKHHIYNTYSPRVRTFWNAVIVSLAIASLVGGFYVSNTTLNNDQYFCDVVKGTPLYLDSGTSFEFEIPAGHTFNYTAMVFSTLSPPTNYYLCSNWGTFVSSPPAVNSTYYHVGFLGFHIELRGREQNDSHFFTAYFGPVTGPNGWNGEEVIDPYEAPPYETMPIESTSITGSDGLQIARAHYSNHSIW
jgi:DNA-binding transcriptional ArsR family regulator